MTKYQMWLLAHTKKCIQNNLLDLAITNINDVISESLTTSQDLIEQYNNQFKKNEKEVN